MPFSEQLPDTRCRIFELKIKRLQVGSPSSRGLTRAKSVCQQTPSTPQPCSSRGLQTVPGAAVLASKRGNRYSQHIHTHTLSLPINTGPWMLGQPPTGPEAQQDGLWDTNLSGTLCLTTPDVHKQTPQPHQQPLAVKQQTHKTQPSWAPGSRGPSTYTGALTRAHLGYLRRDQRSP